MTQVVVIVEVLITRKESAVAFLEAAVAYFARLGVRVERVMTDNGSCYRSKMFRAACKRLGLRQIFTKPYTAKTNGKAGLMPKLTKTQISERPSCPTGSTATTGIDHMVAYEQRHPSVVSVWPRTTC